MSLRRLLNEKRTEILELANRHGALNVRIFGSVVREEDTLASDIDFLVDYDLTRITPWFPGGLLMDLQELLGRRVDILTEDSINALIKEQILKEAQPL